MWPLTPLSAYVAGGLPWISASDLNAIQDAIVKLYSGTATVKTLYVDGTGGNPATQVPGLVVANARVTTTTTPSPVTYSAGTLAQGAAVRGWASVFANGTLRRGYNVFSTSRQMPGRYTVQFLGPVTYPDEAAVLVSTPDDLGAKVIVDARPLLISGRLGILVFIDDPGGVPTDRAFTVGALAE